MASVVCLKSTALVIAAEKVLRPIMTYTTPRRLSHGRLLVLFYKLSLDCVVTAVVVAQI